MPSYLTPGVYIEEKQGPRTVAGVGTSTAAFVGIASKGAFKQPELITNWMEFEEKFGGFADNAYLAYSVFAFFQEGGSRCYVIRVGKSSAKRATGKIKINDSKSLQLTATQMGTWGNQTAVWLDKKNHKLLIYNDPAIGKLDDETKLEDELKKLDPIESYEVKSNIDEDELKKKFQKANFIEVTEPNNSKKQKASHVLKLAGGEGKESAKGILKVKNLYLHLKAQKPGSQGNQIAAWFDEENNKIIVCKDSSIEELKESELVDKINSLLSKKSNDKAKAIELPEKIDTDRLKKDLEYSNLVELGTVQFSESNPVKLKTGSNGSITTNLIQEALENHFKTIDEINILALPDIPNDKYKTAYQKGQIFCANRKDCFFISHAPEETTLDQIKTHRENISAPKGYAALYYPWIKVSDPLNPGKTKFIPPSGAVAGVYARTDGTRGVHKAPAGTTDGKLRTALDVKNQITKADQADLNPNGINAIRFFPGKGICIWGTRTLADSSSQWRYLNIRRLFLFIEESIEEATQWVVFEPNEPKLWGRVKRSITGFLTNIWRDGALYGATQQQAFFVKVDEENNPASVRDAGKLIIDVGVAPIKPAEFVIIRFSQMTQALEA